ncbi:tweety isoform X2 [Rhodnius prolixus]
MVQLMLEQGSQYRPPPLAKFFHALPHVNISLHLVNSTFALDSDVYIESLGILGSIPALWLIITLFLLLIYLCTRCCDRKPRPKHSIVILKWTLSFFTMLCCGAVGVGLYGNDDVHNGMLELLTAGRAIDDMISSVKNQTSTIDSTLKLKVEYLLTQLSDVFDEPVTNQTARGVLLGVLDAMTSNTTLALNSLQDIARPLKPVSLSPAISTLQLAEAIRWPITMAILSILLMFCVILLFGVARHSRCALITFSVFGLFAVIFSWLMASVYLTASVALGDLCMSPEALMEREAPAPLQRDILEYYTSCEPTRTNPFLVVLRKATNAVDTVSYSMGPMTRIARQLYKPAQLHPKLDMLSKEVKLASSMIARLVTMLDCTPMHKEYMNALHAVCEMALFGLTFMLAASIGAGFLFAVLVWLDSHTWIYIRKKREYLQVDEQDPFLPPTAASQAIAARSLHSQGSYGSSFPFARASSHVYAPPKYDSEHKLPSSFIERFHEKS